MMNSLKELAGILNAVRDNPYGLLALAALLVAIVVISLLKKAPLWARLFAVTLVFTACAVLPISVFHAVQPGGVPFGANGSVCSKNLDCNSGNCYPGPHPSPGHSSTHYCIAADRNCALPGLDGAQYGARIYKDGTELTCGNPGNNMSAQFFRQ